jgi:hypothetical protein
MSALFPGGKCGVSDGSGSTGAVPEEIARSGAYLTDEVFLYRVVGFVTSGMGQMVDLEDCYCLGVVRVPWGDVGTRQLRVVTPQSDEA